MEMNRELKAFGNFFTAAEKEFPDEMSRRTSRITIRNTWSSVWSWRASRHCTRGRPAVSSEASCCVKIANSPIGSL